jgi:hypothetical protein
MSFLKEKKGIGVIICRMQVPKLTESHKKMILTVCERHQRIVIFLGTTNKPIDKKNPFPFEFRKEMILETTFAVSAVESLHTFNILPLPDNKNNKKWVNNLDTMIQSFLAAKEEAILYGGRDSFIPYYKKDGGKFECSELAAEDYDSGTELRALAAIKLPEYSEDVANSILWTLNQIL